MSQFNLQENSPSSLQRRAFLASTLKTLGATALLGLPVKGLANEWRVRKTAYSVQDIINLILKEIPGAPFAHTVDTIKSGSPDQQVTAIVTTMFATINVIQEAARLHANFIIAHEPTFYNHEDDLHWVQSNEILKKKQVLLQEHQIAIWRFHDYWHSYLPDGIGYGVLKDTGWLPYFQPGKMVIQIPPISLKDLLAHLQSTLDIHHPRWIGDPMQICERISILPGAAGGQSQISLVEKEKPDVLIVGEVHEWETAEYIRDGRQLGAKTALIVLGHSASEEPGMGWLAEWLSPRIPELQIKHISSGDPFTII